MDNLNQPADADLPESGGKQSGFRITSSLRQNWYASSRWALFFAVLGFLYLGLLAFTLFSVASLGRAEVAVMVFMILLIGAIVFIPTWFMFQFSQNIQKGVSSDDIPATESGFSFLRRFYQFVGILLAIVLGIYALVFLLALLTLALR